LFDSNNLDPSNTPCLAFRGFWRPASFVSVPCRLKKATRQDDAKRHFVCVMHAYLASMSSRSSCSLVSLPASFLTALSCPLALLPSLAACAATSQSGYCCLSVTDMGIAGSYASACIQCCVHVSLSIATLRNGFTQSNTERNT